MGKQHRTSYPKGVPYYATEPFETVHSNVCGPMHFNSLGNSRYFVTFICIFFQTPVNFIKSDAFSTSGKTLRILRSDNGGEYCL